MVVFPKPNNPKRIGGNVVGDGEAGCATTLAQSCGFARVDRWFVGATPRALVLQVEADFRWASYVLVTMWSNALDIVEPGFLTDPKDSGLHGRDE